VKFGQALSTRPDLLPADIARELAKLQDQVPPFPERKRGRSSSVPTGGRSTRSSRLRRETARLASIAQVHAARLQDGREIVVKVLRPQVERGHPARRRRAPGDGALAQRYWVESRRFRPMEIVAEYEKTILDELDLMREAANAAQLRRNFPPSAPLYVPEVYWDYCRTNVLALERVARGPGERHRDPACARCRTWRSCARHGVETFFTQVFEHNFFHAICTRGTSSSMRRSRESALHRVDFGIVGTLTSARPALSRRQPPRLLRERLQRVAELHVRSGGWRRQTRVDELEGGGAHGLRAHLQQGR
jgi:ubiquinone biosynthesis protein